MNPRKSGWRVPSIALLAAATLSICCAAPAHADDHYGRGWWLPKNYSTHGDAFDSLFTWIFWITTVTFVLVQGALLVFAFLYRARPERKKAEFTHGNSRLEMLWTILPAIILAVLAFISKDLWGNYRYASDDPAKTKDSVEILVVGEQFKWNVVYPGFDKKVGNYLVFPKTTDIKWPTGSDGFGGVPGPASLPRTKAIGAINDYMNTENPLGQERDVPVGKPNYATDDDYVNDAGRAVIVPAGCQVRVILSSKDVIHDFFLPNFRVKLDAVPGLKGLIPFECKKESISTQSFSIENVPADARLWLNKDTTPQISFSGNPKQYQIKDPANKKRSLITTMQDLNLAARGRIASREKVEMESISEDKIKTEIVEIRSILKTAGVNNVLAVIHPYEVVCEELCGPGHGTMKAEFIVLTRPDWDQYNERYHSDEK